MQIQTFLHKIAPEKVLRGERAWEEGKSEIQFICKSPILLGRSKETEPIRKLISKDLNLNHVDVIHAELEYDCCEEDTKRIELLAKTNSCDGIIAAGGGKVLDAGKLIADNLCLPCITIPLSASTCAGWTSLSNIYTKRGSFLKDKILNNCPNLLIFDYTFVRTAPSRTLASGIADALAKWYEASLSSGNSNDGLVQQAVQMARVLRDQLLIDGCQALNNPYSKSWERVSEGCSLTAGLIGGIGGAKCRTAAAHAIHNGLTQLNFSNKALHGEIVGFGILVQLRIEELLSKNKLAPQAKNQLRELLKELNLPISLKELGLTELTYSELKKACLFACKTNSDIHNLPFNINEEILLKAIIYTDNIDSESILTKSQTLPFNS